MKNCMSKAIGLFLFLLPYFEVVGQSKTYKKKYKGIIESIAKGKEVYAGITKELIVGKKTIPPAYLLDYVLRNVIIDSADFNLISNRNNLEVVKPVFTSDDEMIFLSNKHRKRLQFSIKMGRLDAESIKKEVSCDTIDKIVVPHKYKNNITYGLSHGDTGVTHISECTLRVGDKYWRLNDSVLGGLFFPNFLYRSEAIRPVEVFFSEDKKFIYVYVFGLRRNSRLGVPFYNAYMAKIIFSLDKGFLKKFVVSGNLLEEYECNYHGFIGF
jgi:hypothetical protein